MMHRLFSGFAAALLALSVIFGTAVAAQAHSDGFLSVPEEGASVAEVTQLQFTFVEAVEQSFPPEVVLSSDAGQSFELGSPEYDASGATMTVPVVGGALPDGSYTAVYRIVSVDGHPASGELTFTVAGSPAEGVATPVPAVDSKDAVTEEETVTISADEAAAQVQTVLAFAAAGAVILALVITIVALRRKRNAQSAK